MAVDSRIRATARPRALQALLPADDRRAEDSHSFDFTSPIDRNRWFVCPTLTPLFYAPVYRELDECHQRRYNQLTALSFSELIGFFETTFAAGVVAALARSRRRAIDRELADCLEGFIAEERQHSDWWRQLNRLSEPQLYSDTDRAIIRLPAAAKVILRYLTNYPRLFPMVFWVMLALEERSLEISRRCLRLPANKVEPRYLAIYRAHLAHEVKHVQIDWHLIEHNYANRSWPLRRFNAMLFRLAVQRFFLPPTRSAVRVVDRLVAEYSELGSIHGVIRQQLARIGREPAYHQMMYSRESTPITFALFDRFTEMQAMRRVLLTYQPH